jgi:hypothetical protein
MTTIDGLLAFAGRRMVARAEANERRKARLKQTGGVVLTQIWHLLMVLGGLAAVTYGVYQVSTPAGWIVGGLCAFVARSLITWDGGSNDGPARS